MTDQCRETPRIRPRNFEEFLRHVETTGGLPIPSPTGIRDLSGLGRPRESGSCDQTELIQLDPTIQREAQTFERTLREANSNGDHFLSYDEAAAFARSHRQNPESFWRSANTWLSLRDATTHTTLSQEERSILRGVLQTSTTPPYGLPSDIADRAITGNLTATEERAVREILHATRRNADGSYTLTTTPRSPLSAEERERFTTYVRTAPENHRHFFDRLIVNRTARGGEISVNDLMQMMAQASPEECHILRTWISQQDSALLRDAAVTGLGIGGNILYGLGRFLNFGRQIQSLCDEMGNPPNPNLRTRPVRADYTRHVRESLGREFRFGRLTGGLALTTGLGYIVNRIDNPWVTLGFELSILPFMDAATRWRDPSLRDFVRAHPEVCRGERVVAPAPAPTPTVRQASSVTLSNENLQIAGTAALVVVAGALAYLSGAGEVATVVALLARGAAIALRAAPVAVPVLARVGR